MKLAQEIERCPKCGSGIRFNIAGKVYVFTGHTPAFCEGTMQHEFHGLRSALESMTREFMDERQKRYWMETQFERAPADFKRRGEDMKNAWAALGNLAINQPSLAAGVQMLREQRDDLKAERDALAERRDALLVTIRNLTHSTPDVGEADENRGRIAVLIAEIGTLRARIGSITGVALTEVDAIRIGILNTMLIEERERADRAEEKLALMLTQPVTT